jgi:required for meiotic nuclear division protein 1
VCWGLGEGEAERFKREVIRSVSGIEVAPLKEDETEDLEYVTDPNEYVLVDIVYPSFSLQALLGV